MSDSLSSAGALASLKAAGEATRLRLLALLARGEHNVSDLTRILGQSQPRISRHLKLLADAGLIERFREGSWVFFRLAETGAPARLVEEFIRALDAEDVVLKRDRDRAAAVREERAEAAQTYFRAHADQWDRIRTLHITEEQVEAEMLATLGKGPFDLLVDLGTGTARILELFAPYVRRGIGIDMNPDMLAYGRVKLEQAGMRHCQVRQGDLFGLGLSDGLADAVILHQVLHFLSDPAPALREAARILAPGGRLLVVDFAAHGLDFLREEFAHLRLGFERDQMAQWFEDAGVTMTAVRELEPKKKESGNKLTVRLWLGEREPIVSRVRRSKKLEAVS
jgi:ArsR family transcriptional regulator